MIIRHSYRVSRRHGVRMFSKHIDEIVEQSKWPHIRNMEFKNLHPSYLKLHKDHDVMRMLESRYGQAARNQAGIRPDVAVTNKQKMQPIHIKLQKEYRTQLEEDWKQIQIIATDIGPYSYQAYITACLDCGDVDKALEALDEMRDLIIQPTPVTWTQITTSLVMKSSYDEAIKIFRKSNNFSNEMYNAILPVFQSRRSVGELQRLFNKKNDNKFQKDPATYVTLLGKVRSKSEALKIISDLEKEGVKLSERHTSSLLSAISKWSVPDVDFANKIYHNEPTISENLLVRNTLISVYKSAGRQDPKHYVEVLNLFKNTRHPSAITYTLVIHTYAKLIEIQKFKKEISKVNYLFKEASDLFNRTLVENPPSEHIYISMLRCLIAIDDSKGASELLFSILMSSCPDSFKFREIMFMKWKGLRLPSHIPTKTLTQSEQVEYQQKQSQRIQFNQKQKSKKIKIFNSKKHSTTKNKHKLETRQSHKKTNKLSAAPNTNLESPFNGLYENEKLSTYLLKALTEI